MSEGKNELGRTGPAQISAWLAPRLKWLTVILCERFGPGLTLAFDWEAIRLSAAGEPLAIRFDADPTTFARSSSDLPCASWDAAAEGWTAPLGRPMPAPGLADVSAPLIERCSDGYRIHYDVPGFAYWMLSRQEEVGRTDLDQHGRFAATSSHAFRNDYLERPLVDEWLDVIGQVVARLWPAFPLRRRAYAMRVSHDVDAPARYGFLTPRQFARTLAADCLKRRDPVAAARGVGLWYRSADTIPPDDPNNTFD